MGEVEGDGSPGARVDGSPERDATAGAPDVVDGVGVAVRSGPLTYRRRIEVVPGDGVVDAAMEDHIHHFGVVLHHDGSTVTAAEAVGVRTPWSTCPQGAAGLTALAGTTLDDVARAERWIDDRRTQCVHTVDLAAVAAAHAGDAEPWTYEVVVELASFTHRRATLHAAGELVLEWELKGQLVVGDGPFAGMALDRRSFSRWLEERVLPEEQEAVVVLRRACSIALGRLMDLDQVGVAADVRPADGSCHTYRAGVPEVARRNVGTTRDTEADPLGSPIPGGPLARRSP